MAPTTSLPPFLTVVLTLLAMGVMSGVQATPVGSTVPILDITSSIKIGRPFFGERLGPFTVGQELTLTCSTEASESVSLSWWEGDAEQESSVEENMGIISSSFTLQTLRLEDNRRRFTCRDEETLTTKTIELLIPSASGSVSLSWWEGDTEQESSVQDAKSIISSSFTVQTLRVKDNGRRFTCRDAETRTNKSIEIRISTDALEIIKDGNPIEDGEVLKAIAGEDFIINCIVQGYNPSAVSWWEDEAELESVASKSSYATNGLLSLKALTVDDSGRRFTCRSLNGQPSKTVTLDINDEIHTVEEPQPGFLIPLVVTCTIVLIVIMMICLRKKAFTSRVTSQSTSKSNNTTGDVACDAVDQHDAKDAARLI